MEQEETELEKAKREFSIWILGQKMKALQPFLSKEDEQMVALSSDLERGAFHIRKPIHPVEDLVRFGNSELPPREQWENFVKDQGFESNLDEIDVTLRRKALRESRRRYGRKLLMEALLSDKEVARIPTNNVCPSCARHQPNDRKWYVAAPGQRPSWAMCLSCRAARGEDWKRTIPRKKWGELQREVVLGIEIYLELPSNVLERDFRIDMRRRKSTAVPLGRAVESLGKGRLLDMLSSGAAYVDGINTSLILNIARLNMLRTRLIGIPWEAFPHQAVLRRSHFQGRLVRKMRIGNALNVLAFLRKMRSWHETVYTDMSGHTPWAWDAQNEQPYVQKPS